MRRGQIYFIIIILAALIILFGFQYLVSIYEVDFYFEPKELYADNISECIIQTIPLNSLGWKIPFRKASAEIEIREGRDLIEVMELDNANGLLRIRAKESTGTVIIFIKPEKALLPTPLEIRILPNIVFKE
jgi:hypothetical protein